MTRDELVRLAREAGFGAGAGQVWTEHREGICTEELERFAALVAAAERNRMIADGWRQCAQGQRTSQFCGMVGQARLEQPEPRPEPISDAKIRAEFRDIDRHCLPGEMTCEDWFTEGVRYAEKYHAQR
jgi:hypothetical protein